MKKASILLLAMLLAFTLSGSASSATERSQNIGGDFSYVYVLLEDGTAEITGCGAELPSLTRIPDTLDGHPVTSIGADAFGRFSFTELILPDTITGIGESAFASCNKLTVLTIPDSVVSIGNGAFFSCSSLREATLGAGIREIGANPFQGCEVLSQIKVSADHPYLFMIGGVLFSKPDMRLVSYPLTLSASAYAVPGGTGSIGAWAFSSCDSLVSLTIPDSVTGIGDGAFGYCAKLKDLTIGTGVRTVGANPFISSNALTQINFSADHPCLEMIGGVLISKTEQKLVYCPANLTLAAFAVPDGILHIGGAAFAGCRNLTSLTLPKGVTSIGDGAFMECSGLISLNIPEGVLSIGEAAFAGCTGLTEINLPNNLTSIAQRAFDSCSSLTGLNIPDSVTKIEDGAFASCTSLTNLTIPEGVKSIGYGAFYGCTSLHSLNIPDSVTKISAIAFDNSVMPTLIVGRGSYAKKYADTNRIPYIYADGGK